jgi:potassium-dependent mechanosensitive channel
MEPYAIFAGVLAAYLVVRIAVALFKRLFKKQLDEALPRIRPLISPVHALVVVGLVRFGLELIDQRTVVADFLLVLAAGWAAIRLITVLIAELYFRALRGVAMPAVLRAMTSYAFYVIALFAALHLWWGMALGDLLVIAGIIAIACGVIFQSAIGSLLTGLAISLRYQLTVGDVIRIAGVEGQIREVDWRFAELVTRDNAIVTLPNRLIAESVVVNHARPDPRHRATLEIRASAAAPPNRVKRILTECAIAATEDSALPPEAIATFTAEQNGEATYLLSFWVSDYGRSTELEERARTLAWYRLRREKLVRAVTESAAPDGSISSSLERVPIFSGVKPEHLARLDKLARVELFGKGEYLFRQGEPGDYFCVVRHGAISISSELPATDFQAQRAVLRSGDVFGERAVLTGEPRSANALALEDSELIVIKKDHLFELFKSDPEAAERISAIMVSRDLENESAPASPADVERTTTGLLKKIRRVFSL